MTSSTSTARPSHELHVVAGAQQGARTSLPQGAAVTVGGALTSDIVLHGAGGRRATLRAEGAAFTLAVDEGEVEAGGRLLRAGESATLPLSTPLAFGATRIAVVAPATGHAAAPTPAAAGAPASHWPRRLAAAGGALAAVSIGVLAFAYNAPPAGPTPEQQAGRAEAVLRGSGMQGLAARAGADGGIRIAGYLETSAQLAQAERLVAGEGIRASWQVYVNEQVAAAVQDVFRVNGVAASVDAVGPGAVRARAQVADGAQLDTLAGIARRDVPGLAAIEVRNDPAPAVAAAPVPAIEDPGKRVSAIVPGEPRYVVTADGTRYFEGALLPTGHRVVGIEGHRVVLEIGGVRTPLLF